MINYEDSLDFFDIDDEVFASSSCDLTTIETDHSESSSSLLLATSDFRTELVPVLHDADSSHSLIPPKPKRIRNRRPPGVVIFPRVVKIDIRRKLPLMLINVVNALDEALAVRFFRQFSLPTCQLVDTTLNPITHETAKAEVYNGISAISPPPPVDFTMHLQDACVKQSTAYTGSKVVMKIVARSSGLIHVLKPEAYCEQTSIASSNDQHTITKKPKTDRPSSLSSDIGFVTITLTLDTNNRFHHVDIESDFFVAEK